MEEIDDFIINNNVHYCNCCLTQLISQLNINRLPHIKQQRQLISGNSKRQQRCMFPKSQRFLICLLSKGFPRFQFRSLEQKKPINFQKKCIQIMTSRLNPQISIEFIKDTCQYNQKYCMKLFRLRSSELALGQIQAVFLDGEIRNIKINVVLGMITNNISKSLKENTVDFANYKLHLYDYLEKFIKLTCILENPIIHKWMEVILVFLNAYVENYPALPPHKLYKIISFLTSRAFISSKNIQLLNTVSLTTLENNKESILSIKSPSDLTHKYEQTSSFLQSILNFEKQDRKQLDKSQQLNNPKLPVIKKELITTMFLILENPFMLSTIISSVDPAAIFIPDLFELKKHSYFKIINHILKQAMDIQLHPDLFKVIFDFLLYCTSAQDKHQINSILLQYGNRFMAYGQLSVTSLWGGHSLIKLCQKFDYSSETLNQFIAKCTMTAFHSTSFAKNISQHYLYSNLMNLSQFGATIRNMRGSFPKSLLHSPNQLFQYYYIKMLQNVQDLFYGTISDLSPLKQNSFANYQLCITKLKKINQKQMMIIPGKNSHKSIAANNLQQNNGGRIKIIIEIFYFASFILKHRNLSAQINNFFSQQTQLVTLIEEYIGYPGLLDTLLLFYFSAKNRKLIEIPNPPPKPLQPQTLPPPKSPQSLYLFISRWKTICDTIVQQPMEILPKKIRNYNEENIELFHLPIRILPSDYKPAESLKKHLNTQLMQRRQDRFKKMRERTITMFKEMEDKIKNKLITKVSLFFIDYPFIADFQIILKNGKKLLIIFMTEEEWKQRKKTQQKESDQSEINHHFRGIPSFTQQCINHFSIKQIGSILIITNEEELNSLLSTIEKINNEK